jgi:glucosylglycerate synthase
MSTETLSAETLSAIERLEPADLVVGVTACRTAAAVGLVVDVVGEAARRRSPPFRSVIVHPDIVSVDTARAGGAPESGPQLVPARLPVVGRLPFSAEDARDLFYPLEVVTGARAAVLIGAREEGVTPDAIDVLSAPVVDRNLDLVLPSYPRHRLDGLINSGIAYPLTRALYGKRVDGQLGVDFGFSPRLLAVLARRQAPRGTARALWLLTEAAEAGFGVGQAGLARFLPPVEPAADVSTALAQVVGSLFEDMERHASVWQRARGSQPVATFGESVPEPDEPRAVDTRAMFESFQIGFRNLQDVWGRVLPPAALVELGRMSRAELDRFRMPDELWARVVYDFALGYRLRIINRDHLLRAMTPAYLAWVASFAREMETVDRRTARDRLERLCLAFEAEKPYLVARWRWPDRFNP